MEAWMPSGLGQNMSPMKLPDESDDWGDNILFHQQFEGTSGTRVFDPEPHLTGDFGHLHSLKSWRMHRAWSKPRSVCHWIQRLAMEGENDEFWLRFLLLWLHCHCGLGSFSPFLRQRLVLRFYVYSCLWFSMVQRSISVAVVIILFVRLDVFFLSSSSSPSSPSSPPRKYILCDLCVYVCFYWSPSQLVAYQLVPQFSAVQIQGPNLAPRVLSSWNASGIHLCTGR